MKSLHLLPPCSSWAPLSVSLSNQAAPAPGLWLLSAVLTGYHTPLSLASCRILPLGHCSCISTCSLQLPAREGARARPSAQWALESWCSASCGSHPTAALSQHRSLDTSHWILTPGTDHSPSRHLAVGSSPCYPATLGQSFLPGRFFYSLLQMLARALTAPRHHLTAEFMCSFPGFSTFFLFQSSQQQLRGHNRDRQDSSAHTAGA